MGFLGWTIVMFTAAVVREGHLESTVSAHGDAEATRPGNDVARKAQMFEQMTAKTRANDERVSRALQHTQAASHYTVPSAVSGTREECKSHMHHDVCLAKLASDPTQVFEREPYCGMCKRLRAYLYLTAPSAVKRGVDVIEYDSSWYLDMLANVGGVLDARAAAFEQYMELPGSGYDKATASGKKPTKVGPTSLHCLLPYCLYGMNGHLEVADDELLLADMTEHCGAVFRANAGADFPKGGARMVAMVANNPRKTQMEAWLRGSMHGLTLTNADEATVHAQAESANSIQYCFNRTRPMGPGEERFTLVTGTRSSTTLAAKCVDAVKPDNRFPGRSGPVMGDVDEAAAILYDLIGLELFWTADTQLHTEDIWPLKRLSRYWHAMYPEKFDYSWGVGVDEVSTFKEAGDLATSHAQVTAWQARGSEPTLPAATDATPAGHLGPKEFAATAKFARWFDVNAKPRLEKGAMDDLAGMMAKKAMAAGVAGAI